MRRFLSLLLVLILFSCENKDDDFNIGVYSIYGKWDWIETFGGNGGLTYTPESTGQKIIIVFTTDHTYREYVNDKLVIKDKFDVNADTVIFENYITQTYSINGNILTMDQGCCDLYVRKFRRISHFIL